MTSGTIIFKTESLVDKLYRLNKSLSSDLEKKRKLQEQLDKFTISIDEKQKQITELEWMYKLQLDEKFCG
jgi:hypothetical protein